MKKAKNDEEVIVKVSEGLDWNVQLDDDGYCFSKYSNAGQDFNVEIAEKKLEKIVNELNKRCENFDCSEETHAWLDDTGHGTNGAPHDMKDLYEDMESCLVMMKESHKALKEAVVSDKRKETDVQFPKHAYEVIT